MLVLKLAIIIGNCFRDELKAAEAEIDRVKDVYVSLCEDKDRLQATLTEEWKGKMESELKLVSL